MDSTNEGGDAVHAEAHASTGPWDVNTLPHGHRRGRSRDDSRDPEILHAAVRLLAEVGYDRLTMDAVAAAAKAGKATLYRRWPSKAELVVDAIICTAHEHKTSLPDTGSLLGDLRALSTAGPREPDEMRNRIMIGLVTALPQHPDLAAIVRERLMGPRLAVLRQVFERAAERGEIPPERDLDLLAQVGPAMVFHRVMLMAEPLDDDFITRLTDEVILPLARAPHHVDSPGPPTPTPPAPPGDRT
jgi:AcrR family transcriptional regulator